MWPTLTVYIGGVMASLLPISPVECGFEHLSGQTKDYEICCFSTKRTVPRSKNKD